ncbi:hypothetical protein SEA_TRIBUTE_26 [Streptomyces phage Tribute]|uniref:Uncharacterized protein n=1 Tax=Streptomyces phage Tribute TaxID=2653772 RepID=A0A5Q2WFR4_9CAUD|nr:hypothetical protein SEA_TRIBUTE_26 [Streptomyces phage Tribute]
MTDKDVKKALNSLYEQRRNAARGMEKAKSAGNRILEQRYKREVARLDGEIENLK